MGIEGDNTKMIGPETFAGDEEVYTSSQLLQTLVAVSQEPEAYTKDEKRENSRQAENRMDSHRRN
jgi:hypothetical protein